MTEDEAAVAFLDAVRAYEAAHLDEADLLAHDVVRTHKAFKDANRAKRAAQL